MPKRTLKFPDGYPENDKVDVVKEMHAGLSENLRHFNQLQGTYRSLASTWLLAGAAGMGLVLKDLSARWWLIGPIGLAVFGGVLLLWILDQRVYHRLLLGTYEAKKQMEETYAWLPSETAFVKLEPGSVRRSTKIFYLGTAGTGLVVAIGTLLAAL